MARKDIGKLNKRITFVKNEQVENDLGQLVDQKIDYLKVWAYVNESYGSEYYDAQKLLGKASYVFTVRYSSLVNRETITGDMMIKYRGKLFDIKDVNDIEEEHCQLEITAEEHVEVKGESDIDV